MDIEVEMVNQEEMEIIAFLSSIYKLLFFKIFYLY